MVSSPPERGITLIGMPTSGKSTVARVLAERTGWPLLDVDAAIAQQAGLPSVGDIIRLHGSAHALTLESEYLNQHDLHATIVSPPGSIIYTENLDKLAAETVIIFLDVPIHTLAERLAEDPDNERGVIGLLELGLQALFEERRPNYLRWAHHIVDTGQMSVTEVADEVLRLHQLDQNGS